MNAIREYLFMFTDNKPQSRWTDSPSDPIRELLLHFSPPEQHNNSQLPYAQLELTPLIDTSCDKSDHQYLGTVIMQQVFNCQYFFKMISHLCSYLISFYSRR